MRNWKQHLPEQCTEGFTDAFFAAGNSSMEVYGEGKCGTGNSICRNSAQKDLRTHFFAAGNSSMEVYGEGKCGTGMEVGKIEGYYYGLRSRQH